MDDMTIAMQKTLAAPIRIDGVGLHCGAPIVMALYPAPADTGIVFRRIDLGGVELRADWRHAVEWPLCSKLTNGEGVEIATVEHLMATFAGLEIDNAVVELNAAEVPVMDGSAAPFVTAIDAVGTVEQDEPRRVVKVLKPVHVEDAGRSAALVPDSGFQISFAIDFASKAIRRQDITLDVDPETFRAKISRARTFGFLHELDQMRAAGLARGGSLDNAVVISGDRVLNAEGLRYGDEFVRHKALDALGDLYLAGGPLLARFHGVRSGHALNRRLLAALFADPAAWCMTTTTRGSATGWAETAQRATA